MAIQSHALRRRVATVAALCCAVALSAPAQADLTIPPGASVTLNSGLLDLGCTDWIVAGVQQTNSAPVNHVRNVNIQSGGLVNAGSSTINVGGNWTKTGTFTAGTSTVNFSDNCGVNPAVITGNTTFYNVSFVTTSGKTWEVASGSTQTVQNIFDIQGTGSPLQISSTIPGQPARFVLNGPDNGSNFTATDIVFVNPSAIVAVPVPTLSAPGLGLLFLLLCATIFGSSSRRLRHHSTRGASQ